MYKPKKYTVMFWNGMYAIPIGKTSIFEFETMEEVDSFIKIVQLENCTEISVNNDFYEVLK